MAKQLQAHDAETNSEVVFEEDPPGSGWFKRISSVAQGVSVRGDILVALADPTQVAARSTSARVHLATSSIRGYRARRVGADFFVRPSWVPAR